MCWTAFRRRGLSWEQMRRFARGWCRSLTEMKNEISICPWLNGKRWVYSITFDEALVELHRFAVPILAKHGVPGHIEAVVGHLGVERQIGSSSYNGFHHMSGEQMREMLARGWGVGN